MRCEFCGHVIQPSTPIDELRAHLDAVARRTAARAAKGEPYYIENSKKWARWLKALDDLIAEKESCRSLIVYDDPEFLLDGSLKPMGPFPEGPIWGQRTFTEKWWDSMNFLQTLTDLGGYWKYSGGKYLAKLTDGRVSDTFVDVGVLACRPWMLPSAACSLVDKFKNNFTARQGLDAYVCGSTGGITLAYEVARQLGGAAIFTEPVVEITEQSMRETSMSRGAHVKDLTKSLIRKTGQQLKRFEIPEGATVLFVEDVITTGKSTQRMVDAVHEATGKDFGVPGGFLPYVLCLVNRSGKDEVLWASEDNHDDTGFEIISLADVQTRTWGTIEEAYEALSIRGEINSDGRDLPYLKAVRPKDDWSLLTKEDKHGD